MDKNLKNRIYSTLNIIFATTPCWLWSARIHNAIATAMSIFNNTPHSEIKRHSLPQGTRLKNILLKGLNVVCQYVSKLFETAESGVDKVVSSCEKNPSVHLRYMNFLRQRKTALDAPLHAVSSGRSMIEMLGVLAIIAVLSVGGIAGYSKAMQKWKTNKATEEYSTIIFGMLEHIDDVRKMSPQSGYTGLADLAIALNLIPNNWHKVGDKHFNDTYGNMIQVQARAQNLVFDIFIGYTKDSQFNSGWSPQLCESLISNLAQPLHSVINIVNTYQFGKGGIYYRGDAYCGGGIPCVNNMTLSNIHDMCKYCDDSNKWCCITLEF